MFRVFSPHWRCRAQFGLANPVVTNEFSYEKGSRLIDSYYLPSKGQSRLHSNLTVAVGVKVD